MTKIFSMAEVARMVKAGGPYIGPKGGKYADPQHKTPWTDAHDRVRACPQCSGLGHVISQQTSTEGGDQVTSAACRRCNPKGKVALDPAKVKALGLPMSKAPTKPDKPATMLTPTKPAEVDSRQSNIFDVIDRAKRATLPKPKPQFTIKDPGVGPARPRMSPRRAAEMRSGQQRLALSLSKAAYKLHYRTTFAGLSISVENRKGSYRYWWDEHAQEQGKTKMLYPYGYIRRTEGTDGGHVDVYLGPKRDATHAYVIDQGQKGNWGTFDEQKVMLGFGSTEEAKQAYLAHYNDPRFYQSCQAIPIAEFCDAVLHRGRYGKKIKKAGARGGKYIRRVPYTDNKGRKRYRYYYRESAAARSATEGEVVKLGKRLVKVLAVDAKTGNITIQLGKGKPREVSPDGWSALMERSYGRQYRRWAAKRATQSLDAVLRHVPREILKDLPGVTDAERMAALKERAPKVYEKLRASFQRAGVDMASAKRVVSRVLERRRWREDSRAVAIGSVLQATTKARSIDQLIRAAENLSDGIVEPTDVAAAIELRSEGTFVSDTTRVAKMAHREDRRLREALQKAKGGDIKAAADVLAGALSSDNMQKLVMMLQAMPGLKLDAADAARATLLEVPSVAPSPAPREYGSDTALYVAEEGRPKALKSRYRLMESGSVVASHDPTRGFNKREGYPADVQERAYHRDKNEQMKVTMNAQKLEPAFVVNTNPDAVNGPPMVTPDGVVLGGNSRAMSMQKAYVDHPDKAAAMKEYLREHAHEFGLSDADVSAMKAPILVREVQPPTGEKHSKDEMRLLVRQMNESFTQAMDPRTMQVALGRKLSQSTIDSLADGMSEGESLNVFLGTSRADNFLVGLQKDGVIDARNANQYRSAKKPHRLNEDGKTMVSRILVGRMVGDADTLSNTQAKVITSVARVVPAMARAAKKAKKFDLGPALSLALDARARLVSAGNIDLSGGTDDREFSKAIDDLDDMFDPHPVKDDPLARKVLEVLLKRPGSNQMPKVFDRYADLVSRESAEGQSGMFMEERSALDLLTRSLDADIKKSLFGVPRHLLKSGGGTYIGPRGGKYADPQHKIAWKLEVAAHKTIVKPRKSEERSQFVVYTSVAKDGDVRLSYDADRKYGPTMPKESVKHFVNDLAGKIDLPKHKTHVEINAVITGMAKLLGKGDDGLAFKVGNKVVKVSTTVPFQPMNPGHRSPDKAADMLKQQSELGNMLADKGVKGIQRSEYVRHGDKGFQIKPYVEIPEKFTRAQLDKVQDTLIGMHEVGYSLNDVVQPGLDSKGEPVMFDVGKAAKLPKDDATKGIYSRVMADMENLARLYEEHGEDFVRRDLDEGQEAWEHVTGKLGDWLKNPGFVTPKKEGRDSFAARHVKAAAEKRRKVATILHGGTNLKKVMKKIEDDEAISLMEIEWAAEDHAKKGGLKKSDSHKYVTRRRIGGKWVYTYGVPFRPISHGVTVPKDYADVGEHPDFRHGTVSYEKPLTQEEIKSYELVHIPGDAKAVIAQVFDEFKEYAAEHLEDYEDDPKGFEVGVGWALDTLPIPVHAKREDVAKEVLLLLREHSAKRSK